MSTPLAVGPGLALYGSALLWNACLAMTQVLIPLYGVALGYSTLEIGSLVALPIVAQFLMRFVAGALADRLGERLVLQGCYLLMVLSGLSLLQASGYATLLLAQTVNNLSRGTFWITAQSLASQLPGGTAGERLGRLSSCNYGGSLLGLLIGGAIADFFGFSPAFLTLLCLALACFAIGFVLPHVEPKPGGRTVLQIGGGILRFLRRGPVWLTITASYAAAFPASLTQSIYPIYLSQLHYPESWVGAAAAARSLGPVVIGLTLASLIAPSRKRSIYALGMAGIGVSLLGSGSVRAFPLLVLAIGLIGAFGGMMDLLYQVRATELSAVEDRSAAMASMGLGWSLSHFFTPLLLGWLAEAQGFPVAFWVAGLCFLIAAGGTPLWHRLLDEGGRPADSPAAVRA